MSNITSTSYIDLFQAKFVASGQSQRQFANGLHIDQSQISRYMSGERILSYPLAVRIAEDLRLSDDEEKVWFASIKMAVKAVDRGAKSPERNRNQVNTVKKTLSAKADEKPVKTKGSPSALPEMTEEEREQLAYIRNAAAKIDRSLVFPKKNAVYFITGIMEGGELYLDGMKAIETFIAVRAATLILTPYRAHLRPLESENEALYPLDDHILDNHQDSVFKNVNICKVLDIKDLDIRPYVGDPLGGLQEEGADYGTSLIVSHPQQRDKTYPVGVGNLPRRQMTTGTVTLPKYRSGKSGNLADRNHKMGGIVVEIKDGTFYARHVNFASDGSFCDLGTVYMANGQVRQIEVAGMNRGDEHVGFTCKKTLKAMDEMILRYRPKKIYIQDFCESANASHHRERDMKAILSIPSHLRGLDNELRFGREQLQRLKDLIPAESTLYIVPSNHNDHISKYLGERRYVNDRENFLAANELAYAYFNLDKDPLQWKVDPDQKLAVWLKRTETEKCCGVTIHHGDSGMNGSRGSVKQDRIIYGKSSAGHSHSPEKWRDSVRVGTSSVLNMDYVEGKPSSWANAVELIYESPDKDVPWRQLVFIIDGKFQAELPPKKDTKTDSTKAAALAAKAKTKTKAKRVA